MSLKKTENILVAHYQRKKIGKVFSLESIGSFIREDCQNGFVFKKNINYFFSVGIFRRLLDSFLAIFRQGSINHIIGDVHYVGTFLFSKRTILTIADCVSLSRLNGIKKYIIWFFWYYIPIKRAARIIVISEFVKKELLKYVKCDPSKIKVIHVPILFELNKRNNFSNKSKPNILHIGSTKNKNLYRHVNAIKKIESTFIFVGEPSSEQFSIIKENCVDFKIMTNLSKTALLEIYDSSDLLLFASTYEGFGMPILEAQSRGVPVITSDTCSMPEVAGNGACFVDPFNVNEINAAVRKILIERNYREDLINKGYINISRFNRAKIAEEYRATYKEIFNKNT